MKPLPYLSETPVRTFSAPRPVLEPGKDYYARLKTTKGDILIDLLEKEAPNTVNSFVFLALHRYFEGVDWHRVIPGFVAQTGDPTGTGRGGPGYAFGLEIAPGLAFDREGMDVVKRLAPTEGPLAGGKKDQPLMAEILVKE